MNFATQKHRCLLHLFFCFFLYDAAFAQSLKLKKINTFFERMEYPQAVRGYEEILEEKKISHSEKQQVLTNLAFSYKKLNDYRNAQVVYKRLFTEFGNELDSQQYLYYAQILANNAMYRESQRYFSKYGELQKEDLRAGKFALAYMDKDYFYKDSAMYKIQYMDKLNTKYSDSAPMFYENGLVFVAARNEGTIIKRVFTQDETPFLDLFLFPDEKLTHIPKDEPSVLEQNLSLETGDTSDLTQSNDIEIEEFSKSINSKYHEGPVTFSKDFNKIIFTRNNYIKGKGRKSEKGINMLKLYSAEKKGNKWMNIEELPFNSNNFSTGHPAFSPENHRLYFVSDMPGGFGGTDIYSVDYIDGEWGSPVNLGAEVNTEGNEMFPFIDEVGNMYFASDGHAGLGGLDIFYIEMGNGMPGSSAENMGAPINSEKDDFGLITDGRRTKGYFSSNRKRGYSDDNIYSFVRGCNKLKIKVSDNETGTPLVNADVLMIKNEVTKEKYQTDSEGFVTVCLEPGIDFYFKVYKEDYESSTITYGTLSSSFSKKQQISVFLEPSTIPLVKGRVVSEINKSPIAAANVTLENLEDGSTETVITGIDGQYIFQPEKKGKYVVKAVKQNFIAAKTATKNSEQAEDEFSMVAVGDLFELKNVHHDYGKAGIRPEGKTELKNKIYPLLSKFEDVKIELRSHTDSRSSADFNLKLSQERAEAVKDYLVSLGVDEKRIVARGYGKTQLINDCDENSNCPPSEHLKNRRTEIKILNIAELTSR